MLLQGKNRDIVWNNNDKEHGKTKEVVEKLLRKKTDYFQAAEQFLILYSDLDLRLLRWDILQYFLPIRGKGRLSWPSYFICTFSTLLEDFEK